jgi:drug/metabolite transporter (DMT)-like permease
VNLRKYLVLVGVALFGALGDVALSRGMKQVGEVSPHHLQQLINAIANPWVISGISLLIVFFVSYMTALSWADLTYVLPATAIGYIIMAGLARWFLNEQVTFTRWAGILLITAGVGFIAGGPEITPEAVEHAQRVPETLAQKEGKP